MADNHKERQQKLKEKVDEQVAAATEDKSLVLVITGNGKGKSTAGFGVVTRAVGHGLSAAVCQFIKGTWECGERNLLSKCGVEFHVMETGFTWDTQDKTSDTIAAERVWQEAKRLLADETIDVVMLDELTYMVSYKYLPLNDIIHAIESRPKHQHVVITGRSCHRDLIAIADTVSEVRSVKHAFESGVKVQKGIDW